MSSSRKVDLRPSEREGSGGANGAVGSSSVDARTGRADPGGSGRALGRVDCSFGGDSRTRAKKTSLRAHAQGALPVEFYSRPVLEVAHDLIGCVVEHDGMSGLIVETEAYHESEPACHAFVGLTPRTRTLFDEPGTAYVYRSYGIHALFNAVCEPNGVGAAVLVRALQPLVGIEEMRARRARTVERELCSGPGKLAQALAIDLSHNGTSLLCGPITIRASQERGRESPRGTPVVEGTRIGITKAVDLRWRFCLAGNPHVSRPRPAAFTD